METLEISIKYQLKLIIYVYINLFIYILLIYNFQTTCHVFFSFLYKIDE